MIHQVLVWHLFCGYFICAVLLGCIHCVFLLTWGVKFSNIECHNVLSHVITTCSQCKGCMYVLHDAVYSNLLEYKYHEENKGVFVFGCVRVCVCG